MNFWVNYEYLNTKYSRVWKYLVPGVSFGILLIMAFGTNSGIRTRSSINIAFAVLYFCFLDLSLSRSLRALYLAPKIKEVAGFTTSKIVLSSALSPILELLPWFLFSITLISFFSTDSSYEFLGILISMFLCVSLAIVSAIPVAYVGRNLRDFRFLLPYYSKVTLMTTPLIFAFNWDSNLVFIAQSLNPISFIAFVLYEYEPKEIQISGSGYLLSFLTLLFLSFKFRHSRSTRFEEST